LEEHGKNFTAKKEACRVSVSPVTPVEKKGKGEKHRQILYNWEKKEDEQATEGEGKNDKDSQIYYLLRLTGKRSPQLEAGFRSLKEKKVEVGGSGRIKRRKKKGAQKVAFGGNGRAGKKGKIGRSRLPSDASVLYIWKRTKGGQKSAG